MSEPKDDWLNYEGLADLAAENQLSGPPDGVEERVYDRLVAAVGVPVAGALETLDVAQSATQGADLVHGAGELVAASLPQGATVSALGTGAATGTTVGAAAAVSSGGFGAKGLALLLTIAGGGAAVTVAVDYTEPVVEQQSRTPVTAPIAANQRSETKAPSAVAVDTPAKTSQVVPPNPQPTKAALTPTSPEAKRPPSRRVTVRTTAKIPTEIVSDPPSAARPPRPAVPLRDGALLAEQTLLRSARRAIAKKDVEGALISIRHHEIAHPKGRLLEERELLRVQALALGGRVTEAERAAGRFRSRFPKSLMLKALDYALNPDAGVR